MRLRYGDVIEEKDPDDERKLVLSGGFMVPDRNSFGHTFRDYDVKSSQQKGAEEFYRINHINQTYEFVKRMREEYGKLNRVEMNYPKKDWLHLTGLIHDLGKVLLHPVFGALPQWAVVGDTYPVGCAFSESIVHHKFFEENPDYNKPTYNTKYGVYSEVRGLNNVMMSWGHDDYMYLVAKENKCTLPSAGLFIIRYHSFYG
ncbi:hypothetical protein L6164_001131 [Bauhinia variegata]|uniref:Uncharacterized protein n=1 Tax=Bauhinia variegata TaxID=167791 RepID=A0ACB9Q7Y7_BAUVA|nr:hypothetical protein L6164_001131 [Bauhinia variegata]